MSTFELDPSREPPESAEATDPKGLAPVVLRQNIRWFIRLRWIMAAVCALFGAACTLAPDALRRLTLTPPALWPWVVAALLVLANAVFTVLARRLGDRPARAAIQTHIWLQILSDLVMMTAVVHFIGSTHTLIAFTYLFHTALACVFFPPSKSLLATVLAASLYLACVTFEILGILPVDAALVRTAYPSQQDPSAKMLFAGSATAIWFVMWYLVSTLSNAVRKRDERLQGANQRILKADQEQNRQVLRTTHDLKAPFSGIETSIQSLRSEHWEGLPESAREVIERIERRAVRLRKRIDDILLLGDLRSESHSSELLEPVDLRLAVQDVLEQLGRRGEDGGAAVQVDVAPVTVFGDRKQLMILLSNLIANAISYSREGGWVRVASAETADEVRISVADNGMGIRADALPRIFDDYFRTREAAAFNKMSTGLGLAIVKKIAARFGLRLKVTSEEGTGTTFEVVMPRNQTDDKQRRPNVAKIKIIDDDVDHAADLAAILGSAGHSVSTLDHVEGAIEDLARDIPDLLILDVMFPENPSAGLELAVKIRQRDETRNLPVILLTGVNQEFPLDLSKRDIDGKWMPVQDFIEKPVQGPALLGKVDELLSRAKAQGPE